MDYFIELLNPSAFFSSLDFAVNVALTYWWAIFFIFGAKFFYDGWYYYKPIEYDDKKDWVSLEILLPEKVTKSPKAMESVITSFHGMAGMVQTMDRIIKGETKPNFSFEIVGIAGKMHFVITCPEGQEKFFKSNIYSQFPNAEVTEITDYSKKISPPPPNDNYDLWGTDFELQSHEAFPVRSYKDWGLEDETKEERKIDPLASISETIASLEPGEQIWIQINAAPVFGWDKAKEKLDEILGNTPDPDTFFEDILYGIGDFVKTVFGGSPSLLTEDSGDDNKMLNPHERSQVEAIESKIDKPAFKCNVRTIYIAQNQAFDGSRISSIMGAMREFSREDSNGFKPDMGTFTSVQYKWWFGESRLKHKKKKILANYQRRRVRLLDQFGLNSEELASMFHLPSDIISSSSLERMHSRKAAPPENLPEI